MERKVMRLVTLGLLVSLLVCLGCAAFAATVTGAVTVNGTPVANAKVFIDQLTDPVLTAADGTYTISNVTTGNIKMMAYTIGYKPIRTDTIAITGDYAQNFQFSSTLLKNTNPAYIAGVATAAPTIDGAISDTEWTGAAKITAFFDHNGVHDPPVPITDTTIQTTVRILYDASNLYFAFHCQDKDQYDSAFTGGTTESWDDDHMEAFIEPPKNLLGGISRNKPNYQIGVNCVGGYGTFAMMPTTSDEGWSGAAWDATGLQIKTAQNEFLTTPVYYNIEVQLPLASIPEFTGVTLGAGDVVRMAFGRDYATNNQFWTYSSIPIDGNPWFTDQFNDIVLAGATGTITGKVTFSKDSSAVAGAVIDSDKGGHAVADANGNYTITNAPAGDTKLMAWTKGWKASTVVTATVTAGQTATGNISIANNVTTDSAPVINIKWTNTAPTIDATIDTTEWIKSDKITNFYNRDATMTNLTTVPVTAYAMYDANNLYVAFYATEPGTLTSTTTGHDPDGFWNDDSVQFFWDPLHKHNGPDLTISNYQFGANATNGWVDQKVSGQADDWGTAFDVTGMTVSSKTVTGGYNVEMMIPFAGIPELGATPAAGSCQGALFGRGRSAAPTNDTVAQTAYVDDNTYWKTSTNWNDVVFGIQAQTGIIAGTVTFSKDSSPVSGAVVLTDGGLSATTGSDGKYTIADVPVGDVKIMASVNGWRPSARTTVTVASDQTTTANLIITNDDATATGVPAFTVRWTATAPTIDGVVTTDAAWSVSDQIKPFYLYGGTNTQTEQQTVCRAIYDKDNLYVAYDCTEPNLSGMTAAATGKDQDALWSDDEVEFSVDPKHQHNGPAITINNYQFAANSAETPNTASADDYSLPGYYDLTTYNAAGFTVASHRDATAGHWYAEFKIPFSDIPDFGTTPTVGSISGMNFGRYRPQSSSDAGSGYSSATIISNGFTNSDDWNDMTWGPQTAPTGTITGKVKFSDTSKSIGVCTVYTNTGQTVQTDENGNYTITNAPIGTVGLRAWKLGFRPSPMASWSIFSGYNPISVNVTAGGSATAPDLTILWGDPADFNGGNGTYINTAQIRHLYKISTPPTIDGHVDLTTEWKDADAIAPFYNMQTDTADPPQVTAYSAYDDNNIYVAFDATEPDTANIVALAQGHDSNAGGNIFSDDHVEVEFDPQHLHNGWDGRAFTYSMAVNAAEAPNTAYWDHRNNQRRSNIWGDEIGYENTNIAGWEPTGVKVASHVGTGHWYCEISIPISQIPGFPTIIPNGYVAGIEWIGARAGSHTNPPNPTGTDTYWTSGEWTFGGSSHNANQFNDVIFEGVKTVTETFATSNGFVQPGKWNLISLPAVPSNTDPKSVFAGIDVANASFQYWDNQAATPGFVGYGLGWTGPAQCAVPYWMVEPKATTAKDLSFTGVANTTDQVISIPAHASAPYWIAIGLPFNSANYALSNVQFSSNGGAYMSWTAAYNANPRVVDSSMQGYNAATGTFDRVNGLGTDTIQPWWGYWMLVFNGNKLDIKFPAPTK